MDELDIERAIETQEREDYHNWLEQLGSEEQQAHFEQIYPTYPEADTKIVCTCGTTWRWAQLELERCPNCNRIDDPF